MKKETISTLTKELQELKKQRSSTNYPYYQFKEWIDASNKVNIARKHLREVEDKIQPQVNEIWSNIDKRKKEIENKIQKLKTNSKRKFQVPENIQKWLDKDYQYGHNFVSKISLVWLSDDLKYGIIRWPGAVHWHGRGTFGYDPTEYYGVKIFGSAGNHITPTDKYTGRLTKEMKEEIIKDIYETIKKDL